MPAILRTVNLEVDMPGLPQATARLAGELQVTRAQGVKVLKLIHGYGSTGAGGDIRLAVQALLRRMAAHGEIQECIFGEDWGQSDDRAWKLVKRFPELKQDRDFGRHNRGITMVVL